MKLVLKIFLIVISTIFGLSCKKLNSEVLSQDLSNDAILLLSNLNKIQKVDEAKLAYSLLSSEQRYAVWALKLANSLDDASYSSAQKTKIKEIKDYITVDVFKEGDMREVFYTHWFPNWVKRSEGILTSFQVENLVFSLRGIDLTSISTLSKSKTKKSQISDTPSPKGCICALNSNFTCPSYTVSWPPSVSYGKCEKSSGGCVATTTGCGALWDQECDGDTCPSTVDES